MRSRYEQLIEYIINDQNEEAKELFHNLVVEKSREIYNDLVAEEMDTDMEESFMDETGEEDQTDDMMGDIAADHEGMDMHSDDDDEEGHDEFGHEEGDEFGGMDHDEGSVEDRVMDLEDALDELKAEFEALMSDEANEPEHHDGIDDPDFDGRRNDDMGGQNRFAPAESVVREYVEKVKNPGNSEGSAVGADSGSVKGATNTKSIVAGKNDMGGSTKNIARGSSEQSPDDKAYKDPSNQYSKGKGNLPGAGNFQNVPGAKAGKTFTNAKKPTTSEPSGINKKSTID